MSDNEKQIYLRVLGDVPFMLEIVSRCGEQADSFAAEMLHERITLEREAFRLEEDRRVRETAERIAGHEEQKMRTSDD